MNSVSSDTGTLPDVLRNLIQAVASWADTLVVFLALAGLLLAGWGGRRMHEAAQNNAYSDAGAVGGGLAMVLCGSAMTITAIIAGAASFLFTS